MPVTPRRLSLEQRLPLLISTLLSAVLIVALLLAYREIRTSQEVASLERATRVARQLADLGNGSTSARFTVLRGIASRAMVREALSDPAHELGPEVRAALDSTRLPADSGLAVNLVTPDGRVVGGVTLDVGGPESPPPASELPAGTKPDSGHLSTFFIKGGRTRFWAIVPVRDGAQVVGYIAQERRLGANARTEQQIRGLVGGDLSLYYRNVGQAGIWTSVGGVPIPAPMALRAEDGVLRYDRNGEPQVAVEAPIAGTPIAVVLETSERTLAARPRAIMRRLGLFALLLIIAGTTIAWLMSRRLTRPLVQLTTMAEAISRGDYERSVRAISDDEIGRLAATFNRMTAQVRESHRALADQNAQARSVAEELERANRRLEDAVVEAQNANRAKSAFLATMSHEIRTPINAMIGYAELLELEVAGTINTEQRAQLERIRMSGRHLIGLVNEVLDFARIESSQLSVQPVIASASEVVESSVALIRPQAEAKHLRLTVRGEDGLRYFGDPQRVRQILVNLLNNAVKFTADRGAITLRYGMRSGSALTSGAGAASPWAVFEVRDSGIGIAPEKLQAIFEPFVQADSGYTRRQGGSGLGLSISRSLAHLMHGEISVESREGKGSCFELWIPAAVSADVPPRDDAVAHR